LDNGGKYEPKNFDMKYHGKVTIAKALGSSLNIPAVKILSEISIDTMRSFLKQISTVSHTDEVFDSNPYHYGLSLAL
jgi:penicillin-binding protein 1C